MRIPSVFSIFRGAAWLYCATQAGCCFCVIIQHLHQNSSLCTISDAEKRKLLMRWTECAWFISPNFWSSFLRFSQLFLFSCVSSYCSDDPHSILQIELPAVFCSPSYLGFVFLCYQIGRKRYTSQKREAPSVKLFSTILVIFSLLLFHLSCLDNRLSFVLSFFLALHSIQRSEP